MTVPGLASNTAYHFAAQSNNGSAYCAAVDQTVTTAAAVTHPVYPLPPQTFTVSAPAAPTGVVYVVSPLTCSDRLSIRIHVGALRRNFLHKRG
jgi:hypothetical protein